MSKKICPLMSGPTNYERFQSGANDVGALHVECLENKCMMWITVYTSEGMSNQGCAYALRPKMVSGALRV